MQNIRNVKRTAGKCYNSSKYPPAKETAIYTHTLATNVKKCVLPASLDAKGLKLITDFDITHQRVGGGLVIKYI